MPRPPAAEGLALRVAQRLEAHVRRGQTVCVAFSGGLDSTVLLDLLAGLRERLGFALWALHVHHGLSPNAERWAEACAAFAAARGVPLRVARVTVDRADPSGLEAAARAARHEALAVCGAEVVALAHHRDDQAETVLLQALRGTGIKGLAAMVPARVAGGLVWLRPLLDEPREALLAHARAAGLAWVDDESNAVTDHDRNFLRHAVLPALAERFPQQRESLARLARHAAAAESLLEALAREDAARIADANGLSVAGLVALGEERRANLLRHFLAAHGLRMPGEARLAEMVRQLVTAREDARVLLRHGTRALTRHRGWVVVEDLPVPAGWEADWNGESVVALGPGRGEVRFGQATGEGIARDRVSAGRWRFAARRGGERIRLREGGPTRTLKNLLQEHGVPAWRRSRLPLLFDGEQLVWVPGIGVAASHRAAPGTPGLAPEWVMPPARGPR